MLSILKLKSFFDYEMSFFSKGLGFWSPPGLGSHPSPEEINTGLHKRQHEAIRLRRQSTMMAETAYQSLKIVIHKLEAAETVNMRKAKILPPRNLDYSNENPNSPELEITPGFITE